MQAWRCHAQVEVSTDRGNKPDVEKRLYWRRILEESATSGISMREFCRQRRLKETQSYRQRRMLKSGGQERRVERPVERERGSFALVSEE